MLHFRLRERNRISMKILRNERAVWCNKLKCTRRTRTRWGKLLVHVSHNGGAPFRWFLLYYTSAHRTISDICEQKRCGTVINYEGGMSGCTRYHSSKIRMQMEQFAFYDVNFGIRIFGKRKRLSFFYYLICVIVIDSFERYQIIIGDNRISVSIQVEL